MARRSSFSLELLVFLLSSSRVLSLHIQTSLNLEKPSQTAVFVKPTELPVSFITPLSDLHVYERDEARFELEVSREPKRFRWLKGSQELSSDERLEVAVDGTKHTLIVKSARYEDEAKYMFEAEDNRTSAKLVIKGNRGGHRGRAALPVCQEAPAEPADPAEAFNLVDHAELSELSESAAASDKLGIARLIFSLFICLSVLPVSLPVCPSSCLPVFLSVRLSVRPRPYQGIRLEFVKPIRDVTVKERETAEFSVELSHADVPVVWYKNAVRLHPSKVVHMTDQHKVHKLAFKEVALDDTSQIRVEAMGRSCEALLTVLGQYQPPARPGLDPPPPF